MKIINASFLLRQTKEKFLADTLPLIRSSRAESGNISYQLYEAIDTPNQFVMVEEWQDQTAIDQHNSNPLLIQLLENLKCTAQPNPLSKWQKARLSRKGVEPNHDFLKIDLIVPLPFSYHLSHHFKRETCYSFSI